MLMNGVKRYPCIIFALFFGALIIQFLLDINLVFIVHKFGEWCLFSSLNYVTEKF